MTLIHGPKKVPSPNLPNKKLAAAKKYGKKAGAMAAKGGIRIAEELAGIRFDPAPAYLFYVSISGKIVALFTGCEGIQMTRAVEEYREGGLNDSVHLLPGPISAGRLTLRRGVSISRVLWDWFTEGLYNCKVEKVSMSVIQGTPGIDPLVLAGKTGVGIVKMWDIEDAYPVSYSISSLDVKSTDQVAIESVEIACRTITLSKTVATPMSISAAIF
ncbi:MAG TPA: phage tail protein [Anaerolineaceae bacterium]|jgi:phage tail-like protein|nr:phage tail protein [Anaerolineaceae bacterium]